jgi:uncharacterized protein with GYD domain
MTIEAPSNEAVMKMSMEFGSREIAHLNSLAAVPLNELIQKL